MADSVVKLRVDSKEYDNNLKQATNGLTRLMDALKKGKISMSDIDAETLKYVQNMGKMSTSTQSARGRVAEMQKAFLDLKTQYLQLSEAEKSSPFGRAMSESLDQLKKRTIETKEQLDSMQKQIGNGAPTSGFSNIAKTMGSMSMAIQGVYGGIQTLASSVTQLTQAYAVQEQAELKLQTIMRQRMNATDQDVQSIKNLAAEQQRLGVIGDEVQLAGAQQVATFLSSKQSIEALLPAMNNLAVQQNGLNVTSESMVNIGNMVGKVMQGQTGALRRVGITFTEAEEQAMKFGTEEERAAALADVINNNVGQMNQELAKTDAGKAKQLANNFGDAEENIGKALAKWEPFLRSFSQVGMVATGVLQIGNAIVGTTSAIVKLTATQTVANVNNRLATSIVNGLSTAFMGTTLSATAAATAVKALTWTIRALEVATVIGTIIAGISIAVEAMGTAMSGATDEVEDLTAAQMAQRDADEAIRSSIAGVSNQVEAEKSKIKSLTDIIHDNTSSLKDKQKAINDVKSIVPSYNATIDAEGKVHDNASTAIANHIKMLDALQRAIAAYKAGQAIKDKAAQSDLEAYNKVQDANDKVNRKQNNVNAVNREWNRNHDQYVQQTGYYRGTDGKMHSYSTVTAAGYGKQQELRTQQQALQDAKDEQRQANENYKKTQQANDLSKKRVETWMKGYVEQGDTEGVNIDKIMRAVEEHNGDFTATANEIFNRSLDTTETTARKSVGSGGGTSGGGRSGGGRTNTGTGGGSTNSNVLKIGSSGDKVKELQRALGITDDGIFGKATEDAVKEFQQAKGLVVDGLVGKATLDKLKEVQRESEKSTYDQNSDKIKALTEEYVNADETRRAEIRATIKQLQEENNKIDQLKREAQGLSDTPITPKVDFSQFNTSNVSGFISDLQKQLQDADFGGTLYNSIQRQLTDANIFQSLIQEGERLGLDFSGIASQAWQAIANNDNITLVKATIEDMLAQVNAARKEKGENGISFDEEGNQKETEKKTDQILGKTDKLISGLSSVASGLQSMGITLPAGVTKVIGVAQGLMQVIQGVQTIISVFSTTSQAANTAAIGMNSAGLSINTAALVSLASAISINSVASAVPLAQGGIVHAANGYRVPGNHFSGDQVPALLNSGELVLNRAEQGNLAAQLESNNIDFSSQPYINGEMIYLGLSNYLRRRGRGEIITSRSL